jgi:hypothetical protein
MDNYNSLDDVENAVIKLEPCEVSGNSGEWYQYAHENTDGFCCIRLGNILSGLLLVFIMSIYLCKQVDNRQLAIGKHWYSFMYILVIGKYVFI